MADKQFDRKQSSNGRHSGQWQRVSGANPCPICRKPDYCTVTADGRLAKCMRVEQGAFKTGTDDKGCPYYLHRLQGEPCRPIELLPDGAAARRADPDTQNAVYDALLGGLALSAAHREQLRRRGLPDAEIDRRLYRTLPIQGRAAKARQLAERFGAEVLLSVPGLIAKYKDSRKYVTITGAAGLLVPVRDPAGRITAVKVRRDDAGEGARYNYLSSSKFGGPGPGAPVHVPLGVILPCPRVRLTEGELKADVAAVLSEVVTLGLPGTATWQSAIAVLRELGTEIVRVAFDADAADKAAVARALAACVEGLAAEGFVVEVEKWDAEHKGIDDALAAKAAVEVLTGEAARAYVAEMLALATAGEEPAPPDPLDRLADVLGESGAEGLFRDAPLLDALARLVEDNPAAFAARRVGLKRWGVSLRDLDKALAGLRADVRAELPPRVAEAGYRVAGGRFVRDTLTSQGAVEVPLANFVARIVAETTHDDGAERSLYLTLEGQLCGGQSLPPVEVPAAHFADLDWILSAWGSRAVVYAGRGTAEHLRVAIQLLSAGVAARIVYGHLGWRLIGEQWAYLHAGGAIGADGTMASIEVAPPEALVRYVLPAPLPTLSLRSEVLFGALGKAARQEADVLVAAVRASLALLDLAPDRLAFPLLAAVYRAVLGGTDFALHLAGQSGVFKTELAALLQQHYGAELDARHLPASWASTGNSLESIAFAAKDALLTVDDFAPSGSAADVARLHREAERLLRAQGNAAGRQRMRADGSLRPAKPPRGLILSTGEDVPRGQSLRARLLAIDVERGDINPGRLTVCQRDAAAGRYAEALAGFIRWLAPQYDAVRGRLAAERAELRDRAISDGQHARTPGIVADLALGLRYLLDFALASGAIDAARRSELGERGWQALCQAGAAQAEHGRAADPVEQFLRLLSAALASGRAHVAAPDGMEPKPHPAAWGWRGKEYTFSGPDGPETDISWMAQGRRVGWIDGEALYLEPEASYAAVQELARDQSDGLAVSARTLWRRLRERRLLASWDERRQRNTIRRTLEGVRDREVLHLCADALCPSTEPSEPSAEAENPRISAEMRTVSADGPADGNGVCRENRPQEPSAETEENSACGRYGRSPTGRDASRNGNPAAYLAPELTEDDARTPFDGSKPRLPGGPRCREPGEEG